MTDSNYNDEKFLRKVQGKKSSTPLTDDVAFYVTKIEGPTGDETEEVVPADFARSMENPKLDYDKHRINYNNAQKLIGTRWMRKDQSNISEYPEPGKYPYNGYTVLMVTNLSHEHPSHPPQVVYVGDNGKHWSLEIYKWPGNLEPESKG